MLLSLQLSLFLSLIQFLSIFSVVFAFWLVCRFFCVCNSQDWDYNFCQKPSSTRRNVPKLRFIVLRMFRNFGSILRSATGDDRYASHFCVCDRDNMCTIIIYRYRYRDMYRFHFWENFTFADHTGGYSSTGYITLWLYTHFESSQPHTELNKL